MSLAFYWRIKACHGTVGHMEATMERQEISHSEVKIYSLLSTMKRWMTNEEISEALTMPKRTVRMHTLRFVKLGLIDQAELFPAHRYRWSEKAGKRNVSYLQRLEGAKEIFDQ